MKHTLRIGLSLLFFLLLGGHAMAATEHRVALVIGNNDYQNIVKLEKAVNDANAVAAELRKVGFEVQVYNNIGQKKMNQAINEFVQKVSAGGVGVFFFAGHGLQINNQNFLVPVDMDTPRDTADVADQAISVPVLQDKLADAKAKYTLLVLDACRNNPLPKKAGRSIGSTRGLAMTNSPSGQTVLYSAGANQEALDSLGNNDKNPNGLFTREFLPTISQPGISSTEALKKTRSMVIQKAKSVGHEQQPAIYDQTDGDFYFVSGPAPAQASASASAPGNTTTVVQAVDPKAIELSFWDSIKDSKQAADYQDYLTKYPNGQFAPLASRRVAAMSQTVSRSSDAAPAPYAPSAVASSEPTQVAMGAAPPPPPPPAASSGGSMASKLEEQGKMNNLKVTDLRATKRDNLLRIQAEITNLSTGNQQLYYRFKWLDQDGFTVWEDEPWKPMIVYGNQKQVINVVSPTFKATDFRLQLQSPDNRGNN
ncbi:DUF1425 domain-containing protein [Propionivibrio sp.]|uniref:DUF1425 domain-containing protein n=1 Tax=Propionivibrio sp. TaxID=2212460 RepID=UPI0025F63E75|nr:DUF1425 domain-containing protein [Propionivibrio sp.]MBK7354741.1 DUF1425 domain-containing protein [Propionivibrio sp.]MBK8402112.1 DUF1425 domain-containing protein [Propionivibrio sp.]MBK8745798.1 DUF1425 domain-containing protein [Propionivibrio sp.]MBK8893399.1 DUF1425 domain-containing protein [Propionivibrio sp.]